MKQTRTLALLVREHDSLHLLSATPHLGPGSGRVPAACSDLVQGVDGDLAGADVAQIALCVVFEVV